MQEFLTKPFQRGETERWLKCYVIGGLQSMTAANRKFAAGKLTETEMLRSADIYLFSQLGEEGCSILGRQDNKSNEESAAYKPEFVSQV